MTGNREQQLGPGLGMDGTTQETTMFCVNLCLEMAILIYVSTHSTYAPEHRWGLYKLRVRLFQLRTMLLLVYQRRFTPRAWANPTAGRILSALCPFAGHAAEHPTREGREDLGQDLSSV